MGKRSQSLSMFTGNPGFNSMGLQKGLCLLTLVFYFSEGCCDYSWRRTERIFSSDTIHKNCKNYLLSWTVVVFLGLLKATWDRRVRGRRRQDCQLGIYKSTLNSLYCVERRSIHNAEDLTLSILKLHCKVNPAFLVCGKKERFTSREELMCCVTFIT